MDSGRMSFAEHIFNKNLSEEYLVSVSEVKVLHCLMPHSKIIDEGNENRKTSLPNVNL